MAQIMKEVSRTSKPGVPMSVTVTKMQNARVVTLERLLRNDRFCDRCSRLTERHDRQ